MPKDPPDLPPPPLDTAALMDETIAQLRGAPADPIAAALETIRSGGTVSNRQASDILANANAVQRLVQQTGMTLPETASGKRAAVKNALATLATQQTREAEASPDNATDGVKSQIRNSQDALNTMQPVAKIQVPAEFAGMDKAAKQSWIIEKLRPTDYKVDRKGFGVISFAKKRLKSAFKYFKTGSVEESAFEALPYVLENGVEISSHEDHKGREYRTVTIAAPVIINGKRGNMGVVVKQTNGNHYKVHRILTPDGSVFQLPETENEADRADGGVTENGSLATPNSTASSETSVTGDASGHRQTQPLIPASDNIISNTPQIVNPKESEVPQRNEAPKDLPDPPPHPSAPPLGELAPQATEGVSPTSTSAEEAPPVSLDIVIEATRCDVQGEGDTCKRKRSRPLHRWSGDGRDLRPCWGWEASQITK